MILIAGPPGSGKGTQANLLVEKYGYHWLSMGELLRNSDDAKVKEALLKGNLVDDQTAQRVLSAALEQIAEKEKILLDGFPRVLPQAKWFDGYAREHGLKIDVLLNIYIPLAEAVKRLVSRGRSDDNAEVIRYRYRLQYTDSLLPVLSHYRQKGVSVKKIDGVGAVEEIHQRILSALEEAGVHQG